MSGFQSISLYSTDVEISPRELSTTLEVLCVKWGHAPAAVQASCWKASRALVAQCKADKVRTRPVNVRLSGEAAAKLADIGHGNLSQGARVVLGLVRNIETPAGPRRRDSWHSLSMRSDLVYRLSKLAPELTDLGAMLRKAHEVWQTLPPPMLHYLTDTAIRFDRFVENDEGARGIMPVKLDAMLVRDLLAIGMSKSAGARILVRTLADLLDGSLTLPFCEAYDASQWRGARVPKG